MGAARDQVELGLELYNDARWDELVAMYAPDAVEVHPGGTARGHRAIVERWRQIRSAFPDWHLEPASWVEEGPMVAVEYEFVATHHRSLTTAEGMVVRPSGRRIHFRAISVFEVPDGTIAEVRAYWDRAAFLAQLGLLPTPVGQSAVSPPDGATHLTRPAPVGRPHDAVREHVERGIDLYNEGRLEELLSTYAPDAVQVEPRGVLTGRDVIGERLRAEWLAFPDKHLEPVTWIEENDTVVVEYECTGTHTGPFVALDGSQVAPTGRPLSFPAVSVVVVRDGATVAHRIYLDQMVQMVQLRLAGGALARSPEGPLASSR